MKFISVQPDSDYFLWQIRVQMNNFRKFDIEKDAIVLFAYDMVKGINPNAIKLSKEIKATTIFYPDKRDGEAKNYISTIRPQILKMFFETLGHHFVDDMMYHDSDILFSKLPDFKKLSKKNKILLSDTISYIGAKYIQSKGEGLLDEMCDIVDIKSSTVIGNEKKSGGAQYFIPKSISLNYDFWNKVEKDSLNLYNLLCNTKNKYTPTHPIQAWTADMWALLWNFWVREYDTVISKDLDFSWATSPIDEWNKKNIYHNAGVTPDRMELFYKGAFISTSPFNLTHNNVSDKFCSIKYVEEIIETEKLLNLNQ